MSEPYSALAQVTVGRTELVRYLDATPPLTGAWDDWSSIESEAARPRVDGWLQMGAYRYQIRRILQKGESTGRFCHYAETVRKFTFGTFFFSEDRDDIAFFFAVARGLARYIKGEDDGFVVADKVLWSDDAFAVMDLRAERSRFLDDPADATRATHLGTARAIFDELKIAYGVESPVPIDHLDRVR